MLNVGQLALHPLVLFWTLPIGDTREGQKATYAAPLDVAQRPPGWPE